MLMRMMIAITIAAYASLAVAAKNNNALIFIESMDKKVKACLGVIKEEDQFKLELSSCVKKNQQLWRVSKTKQLMSLESGLCLDAGKVGSESNTLTLLECKSGKQQKWQIKHKANIKNADGRCLNILRAKTKDKTHQLEVAKCVNRLEQKWFINSSGGYASSTKHDKAKGAVKLACPKEQFAHVAPGHDWGGYCVSCPEGFQRTQEEVDGPKACKFK